MRSNKILNLKNGVATALGAATMAVTNCMPAYAAASTGVSSGISQREQSGILTGALELAGGLIMAAIGTIIGLFGF